MPDYLPEPLEDSGERTIESDLVACAECLNGIQSNLGAGLDVCLGSCQAVLDECQRDLGSSCELTLLDIWQERERILAHLHANLTGQLLGAGQELIAAQAAAGLTSATTGAAAAPVWWVDVTAHPQAPPFGHPVSGEPSTTWQWQTKGGLGVWTRYVQGCDAYGLPPEWDWPPPFDGAFDGQRFAMPCVGPDDPRRANALLELAAQPPPTPTPPATLPPGGPAAPGPSPPPESPGGPPGAPGYAPDCDPNLPQDPSLPEGVFRCGPNFMKIDGPTGCWLISASPSGPWASWSCPPTPPPVIELPTPPIGGGVVITPGAPAPPATGECCPKLPWEVWCGYQNPLAWLENDCSRPFRDAVLTFLGPQLAAIATAPTLKLAVGVEMAALALKLPVRPPVVNEVKGAQS